MAWPLDSQALQYMRRMHMYDVAAWKCVCKVRTAAAAPPASASAQEGTQQLNFALHSIGNRCSGRHQQCSPCAMQVNWACCAQASYDMTLQLPSGQPALNLGDYRSVGSSAGRYTTVWQVAASWRSYAGGAGHDRSVHFTGSPWQCQFILQGCQPISQMAG